MAKVREGVVGRGKGRGMRRARRRGDRSTMECILSNGNGYDDGEQRERKERLLPVCFRSRDGEGEGRCVRCDIAERMDGIDLDERERRERKQTETDDDLFLLLLLVLLDVLQQLLLPPLSLPPCLPPLTSPRDEALRLVVRKQRLENNIRNPSTSKVSGHDGAKTCAEGPLHRDELEPAVELGDEVGRAGEGDGGDTEETIVER